MSEPIEDHNLVILTRDVPGEGLKAGDVGVVLLKHDGRGIVPEGYTIEVAGHLGETVAIVDVPASMVQPVDRNVRHGDSAAMDS